ncbi:hypothetical protein IHE44_0002463 [Lamprotornis superbus]|uniref:LCCL domain-containing protein n=1 Tax=Lamprotornis superbus TaxID=245042 RepID=A0A835NPG4_9PASS|nr:hypothetical protein IHE44_0002463 [Lamprotornis superbus]
MKRQDRKEQLVVMSWDEDLERSAHAWAQQCIWDHGPSDLIRSIGQNLAVHWGSTDSISTASDTTSWYDEVKDYTFPYPHECNPWCPDRCSGAMCTHYTQIVWATTNRIGCAVHVCKQMNVWGEIWENAVYLVCNYSPKGNWIGEAPYKTGRPCSECPPSYGGSCQNNLCYKAHRYEDPIIAETEETNEVEIPQVAEQKPVQFHLPENKPSKTTKLKKTTPESYMTQVITCETKMRDKCRGSTCNRKSKPSNAFMVSKVTTHCKDEPSYWAPVFGTNVYADSSSICKAAVHAGVISDERGGFVDVMPVEKKKIYVGSLKNGVQSESLKNPSDGNAFRIFAVKQ